MPIDPSKQKAKKESIVTTTKVGANKQQVQDRLFADNEEETPVVKKKDDSKFKTVVVSCVVVALVAVAGTLAFSYFSGDNKDKPEVQQTDGTNSGAEDVGEVIEQVQEVVDPEIAERPWLSGGGETVAPEEPAIVQKSDGVVPGIKDISGDNVKQNTSAVEKDSFVKDLDGNAVAEKYEIDNIYTTADFISYKKKRAVTDDGVELYWLDSTYRGKKAKVQVSFSVFKELDPEGVVAVDVEITRVKTGTDTIQEIATGFTVRPDYKEVIQNTSR